MCQRVSWRPTQEVDSVLGEKVIQPVYRLAGLEGERVRLLCCRILVLVILFNWLSAILLRRAVKLA